jgi:hypothetical protein
VSTTAKVSARFSSTTEDSNECLMLIYIPGGVELCIYNLTDNIGIYSENKKTSDQVLERTLGGWESRPRLSLLALIALLRLVSRTRTLLILGRHMRLLSGDILVLYFSRTRADDTELCFTVFPI